MASDLEIRIGAELTEIKGALAGLRRDLTQTGNSGERAGRQANRGFDGLERTVGRATAALAGFLTVATGIAALRGLTRLTDEYASLNAQLKLNTDSSGELLTAQREVLRIAQDTRAPIAATAETYAVLERSTKGLNTSQEQVVRVLETVNKSIALTPVAAETARASLVQFGQALSNDFQAGAQELNSILEQTPGLAQAIARGLGVQTSALKRLGEEGELSAERVFFALLKISDEIDQQFKDVPRTVSTALTQLRNDLIVTFGEADISPLLASIDELREVLTDPAVQEGLLNLAGGLVTVAAAAAEAAAETANFVKFIAEELAARIGGANLTDITRVNDELERLIQQRDKINSVYGASDRWRQEMLAPIEARIAVLQQAQQAFNNGTDLTGGSTTGTGSTETPEQRRKRLREEAEARLEIAKAVRDENAAKEAQERLDASRQKSIEKLIASVKEEAETNEFNTEQLTEYQLKLLGATDEQIKLALAYARTVDANKAKTEADKEAARAAEENRRAQERLANQLADVQIRALEASGQTVEATRQRLERQFEDLIAGLQAKGDEAGVAVVRSLIDTEVARAQFDEIKRQFDQTVADLQARQQSLANQVTLGAISPEVGDEQQRQARQIAIEQLEELAQKMRDLAAATNDPSIIQGASEITQTLQNLAIEGLDGTARAFVDLQARLADMKRNFAQLSVDAGVDAVTQFFTDLADGSKSAGESLRDFVRNFAASMAQIAARALATYAVLTLLDAIYPGLGRTVAAAGSVGAGVNHRGGMAGSGPRRNVSPLMFLGAPRYHSGGMVGLKPDERPAILQTGEEVLSRTDPRNAANGGGMNGYRIVNVVDPSMAAEYIESAAGERAVLNVISRNGGQVRQIIGG